jgi:hypothetical protein
LRRTLTARRSSSPICAGRISTDGSFVEELGLRLLKGCPAPRCRQSPGGRRDSRRGDPDRLVVEERHRQRRTRRVPDRGSRPPTPACARPPPSRSAAGQSLPRTVPAKSATVPKQLATRRHAVCPPQVRPSGVIATGAATGRRRLRTFPAHAGMNRSSTTWTASRFRVPRAHAGMNR